MLRQFVCDSGWRGGEGLVSRILVDTDGFLTPVSKHSEGRGRIYHESLCLSQLYDFTFILLIC